MACTPKLFEPCAVHTTTLHATCKVAHDWLSHGHALQIFKRLRGEKRPTVSQWRNAFVYRILRLTGGRRPSRAALHTASSGPLATWKAVAPMLVCAWCLLRGQRPARLEWTGMAAGLCGVLLWVRGSSFSASMGGLMAIAGATLAWSLGSVLQTTTLPLAQGPMGFASEMLCGGAVLMLISLILGEQFSGPPQPVVTAAWVYLVVFGALVAFSAYLYWLAHASPALVTRYTFVNPVIALF